MSLVVPVLCVSEGVCAGVTCTQAICLLSGIANLIKLSLPFCDVSQCMIAGCSTFRPL